MPELNRAAVSSPHSLATEAGKASLASGGTAMDAAVATNAMLSVVYPHMCGIGGDMFMLYFEASTNTVHCLNATGPAPALATPEFYRAKGLDSIPARGPESATVPGTVAGWAEALNRFGVKGVAAALEGPAHVAESGVTVSAGVARWIKKTAPEIPEDSPLRGLLTRGNTWLEEGDILRNADLARTLRSIAADEGESFYRGYLAAEIGASVEAYGGPLRSEDLSAYSPEWVQPVSCSIDGHELFVPPPNSQGVTALLMLQHFRALAGEASDDRNAEYFDKLISSKREAFSFRDRYLGDPEFHSETLANVESAIAGESPLQPALAMSDYPPQGDTVGLVTRDRWGNACAVIQSIYYGFGSLFMPANTGMLLHNRGHYFSLEPGRINSLEPGKRTMHTLMCLLALKNGTPRFVLSSMGADGQPQFIFQVLENLLRGDSPQAAISAPRVLAGRFSLDDDPDTVRIEPMDADVATQLREAGHTVESLHELSETMGHAQAISVDADGSVEAGFDPRSDGSAVAF